MSQNRVATLAWAGYAVAAGFLALFGLIAWGRALVLAGPVLYGEGAVAHAAILARTLATYADAGDARFTAANYPPLYFVVAAAGDPFVSGRLLSIAATLTVAGIIVWRARSGGRLVGAALGLGWLALAPVLIWGAAVKPDPLALALTAGAVLALERRRAGLGAALLILAIIAKPTAVVVAIALIAWTAWRDRALLVRLVGSGAIALGAAALALLPFGYAGLWRHVISWNALPWSAESAALLAALGIVIFAALLGAGLLARAFRGPIGAYAAAAVVIVLLGGREGATINYLLDLAAAGALALAAVAPSLRRSPLYPIGAVVALSLAAVLLDPLGLVPGRTATTGAWGDPARLASARAALADDTLVLAEDSGLLVATGHPVSVDDLFLWSRLVAHGTIDPGPVLDAVRRARYSAIVTEVDLGRLAEAPAYERARWEPSLLRAIDLRYRLDARLTGGLFVYRPR
ncbi:MAG TPA: hypothetical protein VIN34_05455 [Candidatus Limnocylindria bacterium]